MANFTNLVDDVKQQVIDKANARAQFEQDWQNNPDANKLGVTKPGESDWSNSRFVTQNAEYQWGLTDSPYDKPGGNQINWDALPKYGMDPRIAQASNYGGAAATNWANTALDQAYQGDLKARQTAQGLESYLNNGMSLTNGSQARMTDLAESMAGGRAQGVTQNQLTTGQADYNTYRDMLSGTVGSANQLQSAAGYAGAMSQASLGQYGQDAASSRRAADYLGTQAEQYAGQADQYRRDYAQQALGATTGADAMSARAAKYASEYDNPDRTAAQMQLRSATDQSLQANLALAHSGYGNPGAAEARAANANAATMQGAAAQSAQLQSQEQQALASQYANTMSSANATRSGMAQLATQGYGTAANAYQSAMSGAMGGYGSLSSQAAGLAQQQQQAQLQALQQQGGLYSTLTGQTSNMAQNQAQQYLAAQAGNRAQATDVATRQAQAAGLYQNASQLALQQQQQQMQGKTELYNMDAQNRAAGLGVAQWEQNSQLGLQALQYQEFLRQQNQKQQIIDTQTNIQNNALQRDADRAAGISTTGLNLAAQKQQQDAANNSALVAGLVGAGGTALGALVGGPIGAAVGGAAGAAVGKAAGK